MFTKKSKSFYFEIKNFIWFILGAITAVFTFKWLGEQMARLIKEGNELNATVSEGRYSKVVTNINR